MGDDGPPAYTLCDQGDLGWLPRNILLYFGCLAVNVFFIAFYVRLHRQPPGRRDPLASTGFRFSEVTKPSWGLGAHHYLFRESLFGVCVTVPSVLWFYLFRLWHPQYACAWQYGLYGTAPVSYRCKWLSSGCCFLVSCVSTCVCVCVCLLHVQECVCQLCLLHVQQYVCLLYACCMSKSVCAS